MRFVHERDLTARAASPDAFVGTVMRTDILQSRDGKGLSALRFVYAPGAHSHWHSHDGDQTLFVVLGRGIVQRWGEAEAEIVEAGSWVNVEPGERHWHGALPDAVFVHLAVTAAGGTHWHDCVSAELYRDVSTRAAD